MFNRGIKLGLLALAAQVLVGCSPVIYKPISTDTGFWQKNQDKTVLIAATEIPEPRMAYMGQIGLLDLAIISAASSSQNEFLKSLDISRGKNIAKNLGKRLEDRGFKVKYVEKPLSRDTLESYKAEVTPELFAPLDLRKLATGQDKADYVLLIDVNQIGTQRSYYGFIPLSAPAAAFNARGMLASTADNKLAWYATESSVVPIPDPWDEAPEFPNLGAAVTKNMNESATRLERALFALKQEAAATTAQAVTVPEAPKAQ